MVYFNLNLTSSESTFEYSFSQEFLDKNYKVGLVKLDGSLKINQKMNINCTNNKFYYIISGTDPNNNQINEEKVINIPSGKYEFNEFISIINGLLKNDKDFFRASLEDDKVVIEVTKSTYSIDFSKQNTLANIFGFDGKILTKGKHISENKFNSKTANYVFIWCNLIEDSYVNNKKFNSIYRFRLDDEINNQSLLISIEPRQIIYHKITNRPNKIIFKLVDINNNLIDINNVNLFIELNMKELA